MAGSYNHIVNDEGMLEDGETINGMLECMSGDVVECVTEMYGMIWFLANELDELRMKPGNKMDAMKAIVEEARKNYHIGLDKSPGVVREG